MKTNVKVLEKKFYGAKGVTVCVLKCSLQLTKHPAYYDMNYKFIDKYLDNFTVKGIARCSEEDTFDATLGRRIAESKAKTKAFEYAAEAYDEISKYFYDNTLLAMQSYDACVSAAEREEEHIYQLIDNV